MNPNQREIKFRAWTFPTKEDYLENCYCPKECETKCPEGHNKFMNYYEPLKTCDFSMLSCSQDEKNPRNSGITFGDETKIHIMQFTGLKDKNGVEIYEGDILKYKEAIGKVEYKGTEFLCLSTAQVLKNEYCCLNLLFINDECEVIGNIYENPELLTS